MDPNEEIHGLLGELKDMPGKSEDTIDVLEELQKAVKEHHQILERQGLLISRLRAELRSVRRHDKPRPPDR